jgi:hypothetical protein
VELTPPVINLEFLGVENLYSLSIRFQISTS